MGNFSDTKGRQWPIEINVGTVARLRSAGIEFYDLAKDKGAKLFELERDDVALARLLYVLCQVEKAGVSEEDFFCALEGEQLEHAFELFLSSYANFSRDKATRYAIRMFQDKRAKLKEIGMRKAKELESQMTDEAIETMVSTAMKSSEPLNDLPGSLDAIHSRSLSGS